MPKPAKRIRLLDIGHGKAERIAAYARKPRSRKRMFFGVDSKRQITVVPSRQHNVKLMLGKAEERLKKIPSESIDVVTLDFFPMTTVEHKVVGFNMQGPVFQDVSKIEAPGLIEQIARVLKKGGRVCIVIPKGAVGEADALLSTQKEFDILHVSYKEVPEKERNLTGAMSAHFKIAETDPSARPWRIIAAKRH